MTTFQSQLTPIDCVAGVMPITDNTNLATQHWTMSDKIRFFNGKPQKIGGWQQTITTSTIGCADIMGKARLLFSTILDNKIYSIIGTHTHLYSLLGSEIVNITPLVTSTTTIANSIDTHYDTLANNPITTVDGSTTITIADADADKYIIGDQITLSGSSNVGGILAAAINTVHIIRSVSAGSYTTRVATAATSSTSGGGASVVRTSGLITVDAVAHGMSDCDRVKIASAATTGGILNTEINAEHIIRNVATDTFDVMTDGVASSSVSNGGGASTTYQQQIASGRENASYGQGYGMGRYGVGLYGVSKLSTSGLQFPRIWFADSFGQNVILTAGNQTGLYSWDGDTSIAPALVTNAPTAINYAFVTDNIVVTFGASGVPNRIKTSDQGGLTTWTASSTNQVFEDDIEGADRLISHASVLGANLIFTNTQTWLMRYIGLPLVFDIEAKDKSIGIIAPNARVVVNDIAFWMGQKNFYMWRGGNVEIIPANSQNQSTLLRYVFDNLNGTQASKNFAWYNEEFNEVWFHYVRAGDSEPTGVARVCLTDFSWSPDTMERLAAEYPNPLLFTPRLMAVDPNDSTNSIVYKHESGDDNNTDALPFTLTTNLRDRGRDVATVVGFIPDSIMDGSISLNVKSYRFPQSTNTMYDKTFYVDDTLEQQSITINGRYQKYTISGSAVGQGWRMGNWKEYIQQAGKQ